MLFDRFSDEDLRIFLTQLGESQYTVYHIALIWNMDPHDVLGYRKCLTREEPVLIPEVRYLALHSGIVEIYRKERVA